MPGGCKKKLRWLIYPTIAAMLRSIMMTQRDFVTVTWHCDAILLCHVTVDNPAGLLWGLAELEIRSYGATRPQQVDMEVIGWKQLWGQVSFGKQDLLWPVMDPSLLLQMWPHSSCFCNSTAPRLKFCQNCSPYVHSLSLIREVAGFGWLPAAGKCMELAVQSRGGLKI